MPFHICIERREICETASPFSSILVRNAKVSCNSLPSFVNCILHYGLRAEELRISHLRLKERIAYCDTAPHRKLLLLPAFQLKELGIEETRFLH